MRHIDDTTDRRALGNQNAAIGGENRLHNFAGKAFARTGTLHADALIDPDSQVSTGRDAYVGRCYYRGWRRWRHGGNYGGLTPPERASLLPGALP